jgi:hypothetical protein
VPQRNERQQLLADELEHAACARRLEEAKRAVDRRGDRRRGCSENSARSRCASAGAATSLEARRQLLDAAVGERARSSIVRAERRERGAARLVRHRDRHLGPARERLQERPLRSRQILESIREDRLPAPGLELVRDALGRVAAQQVAIPEIEAVELGSVRGVERGELAVELVRVEQAGLELGDRREQRVGEPSEARRAAEAVQRLARERAADDEGPLRLGCHRSRVRAAAGNSAEQVVEGADGAGQKRGLQLEQVALDAFDVRPVRHDQIRLVVESLQIPAQQERHLPGIRRAGDQGQTHN